MLLPEPLVLMLLMSLVVIDMLTMQQLMEVLSIAVVVRQVLITLSLLHMQILVLAHLILLLSVGIGPQNVLILMGEFFSLVTIGIMLTLFIW